MSRKISFVSESRKARLRSFLSIRGNRQLVFSMSSLISAVAVFGFASAFLTARSARIYGEDHAQELSVLDEDRVLLSEEVEQLRTQVDSRRSRLVSVDDADAYRNQVVGLIRTCGCRLRNVTPSDGESRQWMVGDDVRNDGLVLDDTLDEEPEATAFLLVTQSLNVQVAGSFEHIHQLVDAVQSLNRSATTRSMVVQADAEDGLLLDWDLLFYDLRPVATNAFE